MDYVGSCSVKMVRYFIFLFPLVLGVLTSCSNSREYYPTSGSEFNLPWFYLEIPEDGFQSAESDTVYNKAFEFSKLFEKYLNDTQTEFSVHYSIGNTTNRDIKLELIYLDAQNGQIFREIFEMNPNTSEYRDDKAYLRSNLDKVSQMVVLVLSKKDSTIFSLPDSKFFLRSSVPYHLLSE